MPTVGASFLTASLSVSLPARVCRSDGPTAQLLFFGRRSRCRLCATPRLSAGSPGGAVASLRRRDRTWIWDLACEAPRLGELQPLAPAARSSITRNTILRGGARHRFRRNL